jgi:hypothetical protein
MAIKINVKSSQKLYLKTPKWFNFKHQISELESRNIRNIGNNQENRKIPEQRQKKQLNQWYN